MTVLKPPATPGSEPTKDVKYQIFVYGQFQNPLFQAYKHAAEYLAKTRNDVVAFVHGLYETQYEQQLRYLVNQYGGSFKQSRPSMPLIFAETDDSVLYFKTDKRFFDWAQKRFNYTDNTHMVFYKVVGTKELQSVKDASGKSFCALRFEIAGEPAETIQTVHIELFNEDCPAISRNFLDLLENPKFNGHLLHRVKAGGWVQGGDLVDGSGFNSEAAQGGLLRHESLGIKHDRAGLVGMANHGKDTNGSQFYITLRELPFMDGKSVIFGRVISGMRTILMINKLPTKNERPLKDVKVFAQKLDS